MLTVTKLHGKALVNTLPENLSEIKAETLAYTLNHVNPRGLLDSLAHTLGKVYVKKRRNTL